MASIVMVSPARGECSPDGRGPIVVRILFVIAVAGPSLAFGGVHPTTVIAFLVVVTALWLLVGHRVRGELVVPGFAVIGLFAAGLTLLQWLPCPGVRAWIAPQLESTIADALSGLAVASPAGLTPTPADTGLEVARLFGLSLLFVIAAQLGWRTAAAVVAATGTAVALVGFAHEALAIDRIYGIYAARDVDLSTATALRGPFVNANHQSGLLLLGIFASAALAVDQRGAKLVEPRQVDRFVACIAAVLIQIPALVLSLSRAALLAFIVLAPITGLLAWARARGDGEPVRLRRVGAELAIVVGIVALFAAVAGHGAWDELATLASVEDAELRRRIVGLRDALELVDLSPILGIGRGAFVDLYPAVQHSPSYRLTTHLECAPLAMIVEWGPVGGGLICGALAAFVWRAWASADEDDRTARRIALLGLVALAVQSLADFSLEFLGVAAPAVALAGGLATGPGRRWSRRLVLAVGAAGLVAALALAWTSAPHAAMTRDEHDDDMQSLERALAMRPLDARRHALLARRAAERGDWSETARRAEVATRLRPGHLDAWLLRSAAADAAGDDALADAAIGRALALVHEVPSPMFVRWLLARFPHPQRLAALAPADHDAWRLLVDALAESSPRHADAFAAARASADPNDAEPLVVRHAMAMREHNAALALHHARLLRQVAPADGAAHVAVAQALRMFDPPRIAEAARALERGLVDPALTDPLARAAVEQELVLVLLELGDRDAIARARVVIDELLTRPAARTERAFREGLAAQVRAAHGGRT